MFAWLADSLGRGDAAATELGIGWVSELRQPASDRDLASCEAAVGMALSKSHRAFLKLHDGARFALEIPGPAYVATMDVSVLSCADIAERTLSQRALLEAVVGKSDRLRAFVPFLVIAGYDLSGDTCIAAAPRAQDGEAAIADAFHESPADWGREIIASSFEEWLRNCIDSFIIDRQLLEFWNPLPVSDVVRSLREGWTD
jgi:cell wall assembly regulator SMI1